MRGDSLIISNEDELPEKVKALDPWVSRHFRTRLLRFDNGPAGSDSINTRDSQVYGPPGHPIAFRISNGSAGSSGLLGSLCDVYVASHGGNFRIGWVANHSRFSQIALLAEIVQVALTYVAAEEDIAIREGWATRVTRAFNDHFILVGPNEKSLGADTIHEALQEIASKGYAFHSRGDGSATWNKEQSLLKAAGISVSPDWFTTHPLPPPEAVRFANDENAFHLTDRSTFLSAVEKGAITSLRVHVEGGEELQNPCSALVKTSFGHDHPAVLFCDWLGGEQAQNIIQNHGVSWRIRSPLYTRRDREYFDPEESLKSKQIRGVGNDRNPLSSSGRHVYPVSKL